MPSAGAGGSERLVVPTIVEVLVNELRALVMSGEYAAGEPLREEHLAERFGVSRPPLREALRVLQRDGIVIGRARRGFSVIPITSEDAREIYAFRWVLERGAMELALPLKDGSQLQPLRQALDVMAEVAKRPEGPDTHAEMVEANAVFHAAIVDLAGNVRLREAYAALQLQIKLCMGLNLATRSRLLGNRRDTVQRHQVLYDLIEKGKLAPILEEMANHGDRSFLDELAQSEAGE
jgi:DNA-binding GntR family transcriptional regulator